jgi:hypothetical protein
MVPPEAKKLVPLGAGRQIREEAARLGSETNCLSCHGGVSADAGPIPGQGFHVEDGVQCESCHGPGSLHAVARRAGVTDAASLSLTAAARGTLCQRCHRAKPSHRVLGRKKFDGEKAWQHIRHGLPRSEPK